MRLARFVLLVASLALPTVARADVTVIYASGPPPPLVARPVEPSDTSEAADSRPAVLADRRSLVDRRGGTDRAASTDRRAPTEPAATATPRDLPAPTPAPSPTLPAPTLPASPARELPASASPSRTTTSPAPAPSEVPPAARPSEPCVAPAPVQLAVLDASGAAQLVRLSLVDCRAAPDARSVATLSSMTGGTESISLHPGLAERLAALAAHFPGRRIEILSGIRADASERSRHRHGLALDVRVVGVSLDAVASFVRSFPRTGVGVHRSAGFVHLDVRTERVHWTDDAGPGERARPTRDASRAPAPLAEDPRHILDDAFRALDELQIDFEPPPR